MPGEVVISMGAEVLSAIGGEVVRSPMGIKVVFFLIGRGDSGSEVVLELRAKEYIVCALALCMVLLTFKQYVLYKLHQVLL